MSAMNPAGPAVSVALIHHPVLNKLGETVTSSVTTLDVHDMARICRTYGCPSLYIVTPLQTQRRLVGRMMGHWTGGFGAAYNPDRKEALTLVKVVDTIDDMMDNLKLDADRALLVATSAREVESAVPVYEARARLAGAKRAVVLFGTAHGLHPSLIERADIRLGPIRGVGEYNHLPVRCAAAIIMDRLLGPGETENTQR